MTASLQELFPSLDKAVVADVLRHCADNVNEAAEVLLGMSLETTTLVRQCHAAMSLQDAAVLLMYIIVRLQQLCLQCIASQF